MITFEFKGFDSLGKIRKGLVEAGDLKEAREKLIEEGIMPELVLPAGDARKSWKNKFAVRFSIKTRVTVYQELTALLRAGLPLAKALDFLVQSQELGRSHAILAMTRDSIKEGASLAYALSKASGKVSAYEKAVIAAGEHAGALDLALERIAAFMDEQSHLRDSVITALIYPALVVIIATCIVIGLLGFAVPRMGELLIEANMPLPLLTRIMIRAGEMASQWGLPFLILIAGVFFLAWRKIKNDSDSALKISRTIFNFPIIGHALTLLVNMRFAKTLSLLLAGDIALVEAMKMAGAASGNKWIDEMIKTESESVKHGSALSDALRRIPPFSGNLARWAQVGEAGGDLPKLLENAGTRFNQKWEQFISRFLAILEPALIVMISVFVLLVVLAILMPIMSLNEMLL